ncbi:MAG TPA: hypothetical protein VNH14_07925 [Gemmatimonadales bacterium]|nr:hypothetical protein [Gemmatimonadales bacterium]
MVATCPLAGATSALTPRSRTGIARGLGGTERADRTPVARLKPRLGIVC